MSSAWELTARGTKEISDINILTARLRLSDNGAIEKNFGIVGSQFYRISEIFADDFDYDAKGDINRLAEEDVRIYGGKKFIFYTNPNEYTNKWVWYDYEYINEDFPRKTLTAFSAGARRTRRIVTP